MTISNEQYQAAHETAVFIDRSALGVLKFTGDSRLDLIHRMSTQAVNGLGSGEGVATILTTEIARIIDRLILYASSNSVYALTSENNGDNIARYLMGFVFFNDDFRIEDLSQETAVFGVYGVQAKAKLVEAGFPDEELSLHHWRQVELDGKTLYLHKTDPVAGDGYFVMCMAADKTAVYDLLQSAGILEINEAAFEALRIEAGLPRIGSEMNQAYIPLEAGLWDDVSFNKGCYIGQEIIARMESRGRVPKKLTRLKSQMTLSTDSELQANGSRAGTITSAAQLPDGHVALGYVRTTVLNNGDPLMVEEMAVEIVSKESTN
ncbi:MAG: hypothetical protein AAF490_29270 [Chloroflexota bacterium]